MRCKCETVSSKGNPSSSYPVTPGSFSYAAVCDPPNYGPLEYQAWLSRNRAKCRSYCKRTGKLTPAQRMSQIVFLSIVPGVMRVDQRSVHILIHHLGEGFTKSFHQAKNAAATEPLSDSGQVCAPRSRPSPFIGGTAAPNTRFGTQILHERYGIARTPVPSAGRFA